MQVKRETEGQLSMNDYALPEVKIRLKLADGEKLYSTDPISSPHEVARVLGDHLMRYLDREFVFAVQLDNQLRGISFTAVASSGINHCEVPIQNVFKAAILSNAASIMVAHNHPSGDPTPSEADFDLTKHLIAAGELMGIPIVDHVIVAAGSGEQFSFRQSTDLFDRNYQISELPGKTAAEKPSVLEYLKKGKTRGEAASGKDKASVSDRHWMATKCSASSERV